MVKEEAHEKRSLRAAAMLLARTWPRIRARAQAVEIDLPPVEGAEGIVQAHAALIAAGGQGSRRQGDRRQGERGRGQARQGQG